MKKGGSPEGEPGPELPCLKRRMPILKQNPGIPHQTGEALTVESVENGDGVFAGTLNMIAEVRQLELAFGPDGLDDKVTGLFKKLLMQADVGVKALQHSAIDKVGEHGLGAVFSGETGEQLRGCLLYTSPSPRDVEESRMPSSA